MITVGISYTSGSAANVLATFNENTAVDPTTGLSPLTLAMQASTERVSVSYEARSFKFLQEAGLPYVISAASMPSQSPSPSSAIGQYAGAHYVTLSCWSLLLILLLSLVAPSVASVA
jgi:hypothetical protein